MASAAPEVTQSGLVVPDGTVTTDLVEKYNEIYDPRDGWLAKYNIEREEDIELLGISLASGVDPLFLGDPGVGKTWMIELQLMTLAGTLPAELFNIMLFKEMSSDEVLGPRAIKAFKEGRIERIMDGFIGTARVAYLDEFFKASPPLINALLDVMANRFIKVGGKVIKIPLLVMYGSSNELPDREDLAPARDRWGITKFVKPVRTPEGRKDVMKIQDAYQRGANTLDTSDMPVLSLDDIELLRAEVRSIIIPDAILEAHSDAQERWEQAGHPSSQRRVGQMLRAMKARAWSRGRAEIVKDDLMICQHMAWNHPDHADSARKIIAEFASAFTRKATRMRDAMEPVMTELESVKTEMAEAGTDSPPDELMERAFTVMRDLRRMKREAKDQIEAGRNQAEDVSELEKVQDDLTRAHDWVQKSMLGEDEVAAD